MHYIKCELVLSFDHNFKASVANNTPVTQQFS